MVLADFEQTYADVMRWVPDQDLAHEALTRLLASPKVVKNPVGWCITVARNLELNQQRHQRVVDKHASN